MPRERRLPIDPMKSVLGIERKRKSTSDAAHLHMLDMLQEHVEAELAGDLERIMKTLVPAPSYHFWGVPGGLEHFEGRDATRAFYRRLFETGSNQLERTYDRIYLDDEGLFADGTMAIILRGELLRTEPGVDPSAKYLCTYQAAVVIPFRGGLMAGEDSYSDGRRELVKLEG